MQQPRGIGRGIVVVAAVAVVLAGLSLARDVFGPLLMGLFFALVFAPVRVWLVGRGLSSALALTVIALLLVAIVGFLGLLVAASAAQLLANLDQYRALLAERLGGLAQVLGGLGGAEADTAAAVDSSQVVALVGSIVGAIAGLGWGFFQVLLIMLFLMVDGGAIMERLRGALGPQHPFLARVGALGPQMVRFFGLRTYLNALTAAGVTVAFVLLGVDYALLWGVLMFFMSYVPYIGIYVASAPPVVLAFAEYGVSRALLVIALITAVNLTLENLVMPRMVGKGLSLPAVVVFLSFFVWNFLLGPAGALLSMFLTLLVLMLLDSFPETRWIPQALGAAGGAPPAPAAAPASAAAAIPQKD